MNVLTSKLLCLEGGGRDHRDASSPINTGAEGGREKTRFLPRKKKKEGERRSVSYFFLSAIGGGGKRSGVPATPLLSYLKKNKKKMKQREKGGKTSTFVTLTYRTLSSKRKKGMKTLTIIFLYRGKNKPKGRQLLWSEEGEEDGGILFLKEGGLRGGVLAVYTLPGWDEKKGGKVGEQGSAPHSLDYYCHRGKKLKRKERRGELVEFL